MPTFLGLVIAPSLALACQSIMFALVTPSCSVQTRLGIHGVAAAFLAATVLLALLASRDLRIHAAAADEDERAFGSHGTRRFLSACATAVAALSALVIVMMWFAAWVLSPCHQ
jgi:hypothetical protein